MSMLMNVIIPNTLFANASNLIKSFKKGFHKIFLDANYTPTDEKQSDFSSYDCVGVVNVLQARNEKWIHVKSCWKQYKLYSSYICVM